jgi:endoplasmic reticulum Man9GlcNAc2 1,2-alpha-mannosidase
MGADEYHPISHTGTNLTAAGGIGYTVIDSIDTMLLMGLDEEYQRARSWVETSMDFDRDANFNTFEVRRVRYPRVRSSGLTILHRPRSVY